MSELSPYQKPSSPEDAARLLSILELEKILTEKKIDHNFEEKKKKLSDLIMINSVPAIHIKVSTNWIGNLFRKYYIFNKKH